MLHSLSRSMLARSLAVLLFTAIPALAADEMTLYELLAPETHQFAITYDVTATEEGSPFFLNPIRKGAIATKERVIERSTGQSLEFETVSGKDGAQFIKVHLPAPV